MAEPSNPVRGKRTDVTPEGLPDVTPSGDNSPNFSFSVQSMIEMQRSLGEMNTKVDRLINDVEKQGDKVDNLRLRMAWITGGAVAVTALLAVIWTIATAIPWEKILNS